MERKSVGNDFSMCVQPAFIIGTYNEDGSPNFAPITWLSVTCPGEGYMLVISMYGTKQTKRNVERTGQLTANLASVDMLPLVDYFGNSKLKHTGIMQYVFAEAEQVHAPALGSSRWVYECKVCKQVKTGESDTYFCKIVNVQVDESVDAADTFGIDLTQLDPIVYSGRYHSIGKSLGKIGDYMPGN